MVKGRACAMAESAKGGFLFGTHEGAPAVLAAALAEDSRRLGPGDLWEGHLRVPQDRAVSPTLGSGLSVSVQHESKSLSNCARRWFQFLGPVRKRNPEPETLKSRPFTRKQKEP